MQSSFNRRSVLLSGAGLSVGTLLAGRMGYLSIAQNEKYKTEADSNRVNLTLIPPRRGWILDRHGAPLASNRADFRVDVIPERMKERDSELSTLAKILALNTNEVKDLDDKIERSGGFRAVEVASGLSFDQFAAISVRLPDLPGVIPQRGFTRFYPTGPAVGHLLGYVGAASAEEYEKDRNPLLLTPGYKVGKDGLEKQFEKRLRGKPGARRAEVTARGRVVRDLETTQDVQGKPIHLTIDGPLQDYAARRIGPQSGSAVVLDCEAGDILCMASMPSFDPNSFSDGIGRIEYAMLSDDERVPLRNKVLKGLYPPGSTIKPMVAMAFLEAGLEPSATTVCRGGLRVGGRMFHCHARRGHGTVDMNRAIAQSCDVYFYYFAQKLGMDLIAEMSRRCGLGATYPLPVTSQFYGTVPDPEWLMKKHNRRWTAGDTVNSTIGQGYMLANPLQLAVMSARLATGKQLSPRLLLSGETPTPPSMNFHGDHVEVIQQAMSDVVNGWGTAQRARLPIPGVKMAGKTGTAQVVGLEKSDGRSGPWKYRDHGLFVFFAPFDKPRYAGAVVIEHGGGSGSAYPIARDIMTYMFAPQKGIDQLNELERIWGGSAQRRLQKQYAAYAAEAGENIPQVPEREEDIFDRVDAEARLQARQQESQNLGGQNTENRERDGEIGPVEATGGPVQQGSAPQGTTLQGAAPRPNSSGRVAP